jgi:hypothetical protein
MGRPDNLSCGELSGAAAEGAVGTGCCGFGLASGGAAGCSEAGCHPLAGAHCSFEEIQDVDPLIQIGEIETEAGWGRMPTLGAKNAPKMGHPDYFDW